MATPCAWLSLIEAGEMRKVAAQSAGGDSQSDSALQMMRALGYAQ